MGNSLAKSISDLNLGMLYLARETLVHDRLSAMAELGIGEEVAETLLDLSVEELHRLAQARVLLVGLRWQNPVVWTRLRQFAAGKATALPQALVVAESEPVHGH